VFTFSLLSGQRRPYHSPQNQAVNIHSGDVCIYEKEKKVFLVSQCNHIIGPGAVMIHARYTSPRCVVYGRDGENEGTLSEQTRGIGYAYRDGIVEACSTDILRKMLGAIPILKAGRL
jgi:hypothetical protein